MYATLPEDDPMVTGATLGALLIASHRKAPASALAHVSLLAVYRAIAEVVLAKRFPSVRFRIARVNADHYHSFADYAKEMARRFCVYDAASGGWTRAPIPFEVPFHVRLVNFVLTDYL